jgi:hypothetical protein
MPRVEPMPDQDYWSDVYRGRHLAVFNHNGRWHAYLDHVFQPNIVFATADNAMRWLTARVDSTSLKRAA